MIADLHVEVQGGYIIITLPGTGYSIAYFKAAGEPRHPQVAIRPTGP